MSNQPLGYTIDKGDDSMVVRLTGDIDGSAAAVFTEITEATQGPVILDFTAVGFINSSGIALIVGFLAAARAVHQPVSAWGLTSHYRHIFEITRLSDFMDIYDDETAALAVSR